MRILQISKFYPPVMGGIESVAFELTEGMNRRGYATDVLCAHTEVRGRTDRASNGYSVTRAGSLGRLLSTSMSPALLLHARRLVQGYDIVHVQVPDPMANLALWFARPRGKLVVHWHSDIVNQRRALKLYAPLQRWMLERANTIIATSPPYADSSPWLRPWLDKVAIIPNGISANPMRDSGEQAKAVRRRFDGRRIVFSLGRMTYYKGFDVLIEAAARLPHDAVVVVGGGGELLETHRRKAAERGVSEKIHFVGRIADGDLPAYYQAASVFCLPSTVRTEAFGVVLLEAMSMGKPLVTANIPGSGVPWVNQHGRTGLTVPVGDDRSLAAALAHILRDDMLARTFGQAAHARFLEHFTADTMVASTLDLYRRLLSA